MDTGGVTGWPNTREVGGVLRVTVANVGLAPLRQAAPVIVFEDRDRDGRYTAAADALLGASTLIPPLNPGQWTQVAVSVRGSLWFTGNRLHAAVDPAATLAERNRANNTLAASVKPVASPLEMRGELKPLWSRPVSGAHPASRHAASTPLVADLNGDGEAEVVFATYAQQNGARSLDGVLRVLRGRDGTEVWVAQGPRGTYVQAFTNPAAVDLDLDGRLEVVTLLGDNHLAAFTATGELLWRSAEAAVEGDAVWGAVAAADLDGDGFTEILYGGAVFAHDGRLKWRARSCQGGHPGAGPASFALDADLDGKLEVFAGCALYREDGTLYLKLPVDDGFPAAANFDSDPLPEFVVVARGTVTLVDDTGFALWQREIPGGGWGGAPVLADVDGDGAPEIGVGGATRFAVFGADGTLRWQAAIEDPSALTGATAFDFGGDGRADFVVGDERAVRVLRGRDGMEVARLERNAITALESPVVADADADGRAELLVVGNSEALTAWYAEAWGGAGEWREYAGGRSGLWWLEPGKNGYRVQAGSARRASRLTLSWLRLEAGALVVRLGNGGDARAASATAVYFYRGEPGPGNPPLGTVLAGAGLAPGDSVDVRLPWPGTTTRGQGLIATATGGLRAEAEERSVNRAPVILSGAPGGAAAGTAFVHEVKASDPDRDAVVFGLEEGPSGMAMHRTTGVLRWTPGPAQMGSHEVRVSASDTAGLKVVQQFTVRVTRLNRPPEFRSSPSLAVRVGKIYTYQVMAEDPDSGDSLTYSLSRAPLGAGVDPARGQVVWTARAAGVESFTVRVADSGGLSAEQRWTVEAMGADGGPVFISAPVTRARPGLAYGYSAMAEPGRAGDTLYYYLDQAPAGMGIHTGSGFIGWTPTANQRGAHPVVVRAKDPRGAMATQVFTVQVETPAAQALEARLIGPAPGARLNSDTPVVVTAIGGPDFRRWVLAYQPLGTLAWTVLASGTNALRETPVTVFPATLVANNPYRLRLTAEDARGSLAEEIEVNVDTGTFKPGAVKLAFDDLRLPGRVFETLERVYDTSSPQAADFGPGWALAASRFDLRLDARGNVLVTTPAGVRAAFAFQPVSVSMPFALLFNNHYVTPPGVNARLENADCPQLILGDGFLCADLSPYRPQRFVLTVEDGTRHLISVDRGLERVERANGEWVEYGSGGVRTQAGVEVQVSRDDSGRVRSLTAPDGQRTTYSYDPAGRLSRVTDAAGQQTTLLYDGDTHRLREIRTEQGCTPAWFEYDADGRLMARTDGAGGRTRFLYALDSRTVETQEAAGGVTVERFDARGRLLDRVLPGGGRISWAWDDQGRLTTVVYPTGARLERSYDHAGRLAEDREAGVVRRYGYDAAGRLASLTHSDGATEIWTYDANGNVVRWEIRDAQATPLERSTWTYDAGQRVDSLRDGAGLRTWFDYDNLGRLSGVRAGDGSATAYRYDAAGLLTAWKGPDGAETLFGYDMLRRLSQVSSSGAMLAEYRYTPDGFLRNWVDAERRVSAFETNCRGDLLRAQTPDGGVTQFDVNSARQVVRLVRPDGGIGRREYDPAGRLVLEVTPASRVERSYDGAGRRTAVTHDAAGRRQQWRWIWNEAGDPRSLTRGDGRGLAWEWDARRRPAAVRVSGLAGITYRWDGAERLTEARAGGHAVWLEYDLAGRVVRQTATSGTVTESGYDAAGRIASVRVRRAETPVFAADWEYDRDGRLREPSAGIVAAPQVAAAVYEFDWQGRRGAETVNGVRREFWWNGENLLAVGDDLYVTHPGSGLPLFALLAEQAVFFVSDPLGNVIALVDGKGSLLRRYRYDAQGRPLEPSDAADTNRLRWRGRLFDPESGVTWIGLRAFDPAAGRYLSPLPAEDLYHRLQEELRTAAAPVSPAGAHPIGPQARPPL